MRRDSTQLYFKNVRIITLQSSLGLYKIMKCTSIPISTSNVLKEFICIYLRPLTNLSQYNCLQSSKSSHLAITSVTCNCRLSMSPLIECIAIYFSSPLHTHPAPAYPPQTTCPPFLFPVLTKAKNFKVDPPSHFFFSIPPNPRLLPRISS